MRYLMTIRYIGTNYHGWQVQQNATAVQPTVQDALEKILGFRPNVTGCSRTDSGVHALKYCFHFDCDGKISPEKMVCAINAKLPSDIAAYDCKAVPDDFHARYSVKNKRYIYKIYNGRQRNPFCEKLAHHITTPLDADLMNKAAVQFIGTYDFTAFCAAGASTVDNVRTVYDANVNRSGDDVTFSVCADGFLYNMVRIMTGTLIDVSYGKISADEIADIINSKDRQRAGVTAPPHGLYLYDVKY